MRPVPRPKTTTDKDYSKLYDCLGVHRNGSPEVAIECPFCGRDDKCSVNVVKGTFRCLHGNSCGETGNQYTFVRRYHVNKLQATTDEQRRSLKEKRGWGLQTIKRFDLAWDAEQACWLFPYRNMKGEIVNLLRYWPGQPKGHKKAGDKWLLPDLPACLFGLRTETLAGALAAKGTKRKLLVLEGACDLISVDQHLRESKTRERYELIAAHSCNTCTEQVAEYLRNWQGGEARICFDNDKAGKDGQATIVKALKGAALGYDLTCMDWPVDTKPGYDVSDLIRDGSSIVEYARKHCTKADPNDDGKELKLTWGKDVTAPVIEWMDQGYIPYGKFVSFSGEHGTHKSDIARYLAAAVTAGLPMPGSEKIVEQGNVIIFTSEDTDSESKALIDLAGGDSSKVMFYDLAKEEESVRVNECVAKVEHLIKANGVRLVILDALNSFVGGTAKSDSESRDVLSGPLARLARRTGACIIGIRNWNRDREGTNSQRSLGPISFSHLSRCAMNTKRIETRDKKGKVTGITLLLEFEKVSGAKQPEPLRFEVESLSKPKENDPNGETLFWRRVTWPMHEARAMAAGMKRMVAKNGSKITDPVGPLATQAVKG